ncbi:MAG: putative glycoside hydrolase [Lachnospiraceae bacterium]|nr:putative glycoside hydrolase [Lachnospiraceae bacterium]
MCTVIELFEMKRRRNFISSLLILLITGCLCLGCGSGETESMSQSVSGAEIGEADSLSANDLEDEVADADAINDVDMGSGGTVSGNSMEGDLAGEDAEVQDTRREPVKVKGIYVSGPTAGIAKMDDLIDLVDQTELNAMVIDIKNDEGKVTYKMQSEQVLEIDAGVRYIADIDELVAKCKEKDIYLIARIVAFRDPYLAEQKPEWAVHTKSGEIFRDKSGLAWVNPYCREVWDYLVEIASQAAQVGFDEVQFDYIRFSTDILEGEVDYGPEAENVDKIEIITEFTEYLYEQLAPQGVYVAADVFGTVIDNETDQAIVGQDYVQMAQHLDYICPMVYPSHYHNGSYGIAVPDAEPYQTIYAAASASVEVLDAVPEKNRAHVRLWLQSFTASWVSGHISYGPKQIRQQIKGAYDAGYDEWILWNASVNYQPDAFLTEEEAEAERLQWDAERQAAEEAETTAAENDEPDASLHKVEETVIMEAEE